MAFLYDYNGNPIAFIEDHTHVFEDTIRPSSSPMASPTEDGFMNKNDKYYLNTIETDLKAIESKITAGVFKKVKDGTLVSGRSFNTTLNEVSATATSIVFTEEPIPSDKIATAKVVSDATSEYKVYMYLDGDTIKVSPELSDVTIFANSNTDYMFEQCSSFTSMDLTYLNTSKIQRATRMFYMCQGLTSLDVSNFDTSNIQYMSGMFSGCTSLTSLDLSNFDTSNVIDMDNMFAYNEALLSLNISSFNTSKVRNMRFMFYRLTYLPSIYVLNFDTSNVTDMTQMFYQCRALTELDLSNFRTPLLTYASSMFASCDKLARLNISNMDVSKVSSMYSMFSDCGKLNNLDFSNFSTDALTTMNDMFVNCASLTSLDLSKFNISKVDAMQRSFKGCTKLTATITVSNPSLTYYPEVFTACSTDSGAKLIVNYAAGCETVATNMVATKSANSNVVLGTLVS